MRLHGPQQRFELDIGSGPDCEDWCRVKVTLDGPEGRWSGTAPCLQGKEVAMLAGWLEMVAENTRQPAEIRFLEPELSFMLVPGEQPMLRLILKWNLRPLWARKETAEDYAVDYPAKTWTTPPGGSLPVEVGLPAPKEKIDRRWNAFAGI